MKNAKITAAVTFATLCGIASACGASNATPSAGVKSAVGKAAANASESACSIDGPREQLQTGLFNINRCSGVDGFDQIWIQIKGSISSAGTEGSRIAATGQGRTLRVYFGQILAEFNDIGSSCVSGSASGSNGAPTACTFIISNREKAGFKSFVRPELFTFARNGSVLNEWPLRVTFSALNIDFENYSATFPEKIL